jgi:superfamily II DNA or RNA helicase
MHPSPDREVAYDIKAVRRWFTASTLDKARDYVDSVTTIAWGRGTLFADVQGSERRPYTVSVSFLEGRLGLQAEGSCSCPVGINCKHVAAALLANLEKTTVSADQPRPEMLRWLEGFRAQCQAIKASADRKVAKNDLGLLYLLGWAPHQQCYAVSMFKVHRGVKVTLRRNAEAWTNVPAALLKPPKFVTEQDLPILRGLWMTRKSDYDLNFFLRGEAGADLLERLVATGRLYLDTVEESDSGQADAAYRGPLRPAGARASCIAWQVEQGGLLRPALQVEPAAEAVTMVEPPWYLDPVSLEAGLVELPAAMQAVPSRSVAGYLSMPPILPVEAALVAAVLNEAAPALPPPPLEQLASMRTLDVEPMPLLALDARSVYLDHNGHYAYRPHVLDFGTVDFLYDDIRVPAYSDTTLFADAGQHMVQVKRKPEAEAARIRQLKAAGLRKVTVEHHEHHGLPRRIFTPRELGGWDQVMQDGLPLLRSKGWQVAMSPDSRFNVIDIDAIDGVARQDKDGWFSLELGITVNERTVRLEPLLLELFRRDPRWRKGLFEGIKDDEAIELKTPEGERLRLRAGRLKPVVRTLIDLFDTMQDGELRLGPLDTGRLDALNDTGRWEFHGDGAVRELAQRLREGGGLQPTKPPRGLKAALRPYQQQGLDWMQFLRRHQLAGVLADDMGLGKTVQTLAHVLAEKQAGRLDRPALVVMPTTLVPNWLAEAARFAPGLKVLSLHGAQRKDSFDRIGESDLVLTTYPLVWRDHEALAAHAYHLLILDEAQYVKNAASRGAAAIRQLDARHRLCLTGTPLENNLGELWAQFDFLLPGFLGSQQDFNKRWRNPIEKFGDDTRRELLARRLRPFMLRRKKDQVATELPPKTQIVTTVELEAAQRDLYETVRTAMQKKVREAIAGQGLARSHIIVLDALLKLRQVCCDPRLVKLRGAKAAQSAKLAMLMTMLPALLDEGRKVLLFSQFTAMLDLIAEALDAAGIPYVMLTGETGDRSLPVQRFQGGEVPLFLISLKAGGVGLNLTAADTVIHYDPWWNPAAENQATDRAHRLGQDKPVFVYKLIVAGSIEEKIVALQERKAALADSILSDRAAGSAAFSSEDIEALFAPLPALPGES